MNNSFFEYIGIGSIDYGIVVLVLAIMLLVSLILNIVTMVKLNQFSEKYQKFMQGKNAASLEQEIMALTEDNRFMKNNIEKNRKNIEKLVAKNKDNVQKIGLVKYDAFSEMGGKLSYAIALLDDHNDGIIINSVHSTGGCYSYTKSIKNGTGDIDFSAEEKQAVDMAIKGH